MRLLEEFEDTGLKRRVFSKHFQTVRIPVIYGTVLETKNICQIHEDVDTAVKTAHVMAIQHMALAELCREIEEESHEERSVDFRLADSGN